MRGRRGVLSLMVCLSLQPVLATAANYVADNHSWTITCNGSGYQLK